MIDLAVVAFGAVKNEEFFGFQEVRHGHAGADAEKGGPVTAIVVPHGQELAGPQKRDYEEAQNRRLFAHYIMAAGGAGSSGRPAFESGRRTMMNPNSSITAKPSRYEGSPFIIWGKNCS